GSFEAAVLIMKDYVVKRMTRLDSLANDALIPATPALTYAGPANYPVNKIELNATGVAGVSAIQWRVGQIRTASPGVRGIYEIEDAWESPEFTTISPSFTLPAEAMRVGRTYRARVKVKDAQGRWSHWSAPVEFTTTEPDNSASLQQYLKLTEIMYNPPAGSEFEYLELNNSSTNIPLELGGVTFANGIEFTFPEGSRLLPGESALLVQTANVAAFRQHYGLLPQQKIFGPYSGSLNNNGERLELLTAVAGTQIFSFEYNDGPGWPKVADGTGHSLEHMTGSYEYGRNWMGSPLIGGTPLSQRVLTDEGIVINEVNAHTDYTNPARPEYDSNDWIELFNRGSAMGLGLPVNLRDYYLSDDAADLRKWRLPDVSLPLGARITFDEVTDFHTPITTGFGLNKAGETVYLSHLPSSGVQQVVDVLRFRGQENGFSVGRYPDGGEFDYTVIPTREAANVTAGASLVIREIMYHPKLDTNFADQVWQEFIEIQNVTSAAIQLWNTNATFRLSGGINFSFPQNFTVPANGSVVVTSFAPTNSTEVARFKNFYGVGSSNITVVGPFTGQLANSSDRITLEKPDAPDAVGEPIVWVVVDEVIYTDASGADGTSESLHRASHTRTGNDPANIFAAAPTPGFATQITNGDRDNDGMPDEWELVNGFDPDDASDASLDSDNDGLTNVEEYRAGTNPKSAGSRFDLEVARVGSSASLTFESISGKTYSILYADVLATGQWQKLRDVSGASGAVTVNDPSPLESERFYRLVTPSQP
ncbi:MAG: lamin tail domain-containing protein, partial [Limisphaerales bacterium]